MTLSLWYPRFYFLSGNVLCTAGFAASCLQLSASPSKLWTAAPGGARVPTVQLSSWGWGVTEAGSAPLVKQSLVADHKVVQEGQLDGCL